MARFDNPEHIEYVAKQLFSFSVSANDASWYRFQVTSRRAVAKKQIRQVLVQPSGR